MVNNLHASQMMPHEKAEEAAPTRLFYWSSAVLIFLSVVAETQFPITLAETNLDAQLDSQVALVQGSALRQLCYFLILCIGVACFTRIKDLKVSWRNPLTFVYGALLAWCFVSMTWADEPFTSLKRLLAYLFMVIGAAGISLLWSREQTVKFMSFWGAAGLTLGVVAEVVLGGFKPWISDYRFAGTLHENVQGFCCLFLVVSSLAAADADASRKTLFRSLALYGLVFLVLTKSRSSFMGITVALLVYVLLTRSMMTKVWVSAVLGTSALVLYMTDVLSPVIGFLSRNGEGVGNLTGRTELWQLAEEFVRERPLTGYGYQAFWTVQHIDYFSSEFHWQASSAHSSYLESLLMLGYIGMVLHVLVLALGVVLGGLYYKLTKAPIYALAAAMCAALLTVGTLESAVLISAGPYHFGLALLVACLCIQRRYKAESKKAIPNAEQELGSGQHGFGGALLDV